jgi:hypothetical protein
MKKRNAQRARICLISCCLVARKVLGWGLRLTWLSFSTLGVAMGGADALLCGNVHHFKGGAGNLPDFLTAVETDTQEMTYFLYMRIGSS